MRVALTDASRNALLNLARRVIRAKVLGEGAMEPDPPLNEELVQPAGSFVSLHELRTHKLRGCVGRLDASAPLWESVKQTADSVLSDPRFVNHRVQAEDLPQLSIEISILSPLRPCRAAEFDLLNDGIYVTFGGRSGCFLPQVARETGWSREQLLDRLCAEKLQLPPQIWKHPETQFAAFPVQQIGPEPFELA